MCEWVPLRTFSVDAESDIAMDVAFVRKSAGPRKSHSGQFRKKYMFTKFMLGQGGA